MKKAKRNGLSKGRSIGEVKQLLDQARLDGNKNQINIWQAVLDKLNNDKDKNKL